MTGLAGATAFLAGWAGILLRDMGVCPFFSLERAGCCSFSSGFNDPAVLYPIYRTKASWGSNGFSFFHRRRAASHLRSCKPVKDLPVMAGGIDLGEDVGDPAILSDDERGARDTH